MARQLRAAIIDVLAVELRAHRVSVGTGTRKTRREVRVQERGDPAVTVLGLQLGCLLGGIVIIEQIFSIPGLGTYMLRALTRPTCR